MEIGATSAVQASPQLPKSKNGPIQFIEFVPKKGFTVTKEAAEFLNSLENEQLGIVAIAGKYRTGKSFFVNRILLDCKEGGFGVGSTIKACTKGLWLWSDTLPAENPDYPNTRVLVIDTEGFGGIEENQNHDSKIFLLAILLSSYFIYNSMGTIDENAFQSLNLVINMAKEVKLGEDGGELSEEDIATNFPSFLWVVRDFALKLINQDGKKLTAPEYLENCLQPVKGVSENAENKNKVRRLLKFFFQDRDCVTVVRPAEAEEEIQQLNKADMAGFRKEFVETMMKTKSKIFRKVRPKKFNGLVLNGPMYLELARSYVDVLNSGKTPNIQGSWTYLLENENHRAIENSVREIENRLRGMDTDQLLKDKDWREKMVEMAKQHFRSRALGDGDERQGYEAELEKELLRKLELFYLQKVTAQKDQVRAWMRAKGEDLMNRVKESSLGGYSECEELLSSLEVEFKQEYSYLPEEVQQQLITEFRAEQQKHLFSWIHAQQLNSQKREKQAQEMRLRQAEEEAERREKLSQIMAKDMEDRINALESANKKVRAEQEQLLERNQNEVEVRLKLEAELAAAKRLHLDSTEKLEKDHSLALLSTQKEIESLKQQFFLDKADLEKRILLMEQELNFRRKEIKDLTSQVDYERQDKKRLNEEIDRLNQKLESKKELGADEMVIKHEDYAHLESTIHDQINSLRQLESKHSEEKLGRQLAEKRAEMLEEKLNENKAMSETLIENLRSQIRNEDLNRSEISHLKRLTESEQESKLKKLEANLEKLQMYKFVFKYAQTIQCAICSRFFSSAVFVDHVLSELPPEQNPFKESDVSILKGLEEKEEKQHRLTAITVSISQTMVREESNKTASSYTEYVIQVRTDTCSWSVSRRYRAFCELNNQLVTTFPYVKLPASSKEIFGTKDNLTKMLNARKPTVIEERRLNLQTYLRDLLKIDVVSNSQVLREFLEIDRYYDSNNIYKNGGRARDGGSVGPRNTSSTTRPDSVFDNQSLLRKGAPQLSLNRHTHNTSEMQYDDNMSADEKQRYFLRKLNKDLAPNTHRR